MINDYQVISDDDLGLFSSYINLKILEGWQPIGGISVIESGEYPNTTKMFYQAMVK